MRKKRLTFDAWKDECAAVAVKLLGFSDLLDDADPYDVADEMSTAYPGESPQDFIERMFEEDLAKQAYDDDLLSQSLEEDPAG